MKVYRTDEIRNVVLLGHGGSGKTSLAEAMAYVSGATNRMGKITDGNTISDFDKEEQKREFSISTSLIPIEWEKAKINILDTPGYFDFVGEVPLMQLLLLYPVKQELKSVQRKHGNFVTSTNFQEWYM